MLAEYGIAAGPDPDAIGVWVDGKKVAAIGVHISRWVTSHGFALNLDTDLSYYRHIVPCGLSKPVTSMKDLGAANASRGRVIEQLTRRLAEVFDLNAVWRVPLAGDNEIVLNSTEKI